MKEPTNILLVDDRPENLLALEAVLSGPDYRLVKAKSGEEALKYLLKDEYAVIVLDVQMPGLSGFETAEIIKSRQKTKDTPIIFVTAISKEPEHVLTGYSVGAVDYMFKPFDPEALKAKTENFASIHKNRKRLEGQADELRKHKKELESINQELSQKTKELKRLEALSRIIGDTSRDTMIALDEQGKVLTSNLGLKKMFGYEPQEVIGEQLKLLLPGFSREEQFEQLFPHRDNETYVVQSHTEELVGLGKCGNTFPVEFLIGKARLYNQTIYACTIRDITERREQIAALEHQALHDSLTGLPNRTLLFDRVQQALHFCGSEGQPLALLVLDLNHFKAINDTLGHLYGDYLLKEVSLRLISTLPDEATVARLGGDEFAVLLHSYQLLEVVAKVKEMLEVLAEPYEIEGQTLAVDASLGIAMFPKHGEDGETLLRRADVAMYNAKRAQSGYAIYSSHNDPNSLGKLKMIAELKQAIEDEQLMVYYQPKVDIKTGEIKGVEALARWDHPRYGFIPPSEFILLAEQNALIKSLTLSVLEQVLGQCRDWQQASGLTVPCAVNLSTSNLQDVQLSTKIVELLEKWELEPSTLVLEITESTLMADPIRSMETLTRLESLGVNISIDDFGTGYSSLSYLKNLPVNEVKIDKSFVMDMASDENDYIIVRSIINLAHNLGLKVVAEGIETRENWDLLMELHCDEGQGYYISRPVPPEEITSFICSRLDRMRS